MIISPFLLLLLFVTPFLPEPIPLSSSSPRPALLFLFSSTTLHPTHHHHLLPLLLSLPPPCSTRGGASPLTTCSAPQPPAALESVPELSVVDLGFVPEGRSTSHNRSSSHSFQSNKEAAKKGAFNADGGCPHSHFSLAEAAGGRERLLPWLPFRSRPRSRSSSSNTNNHSNQS